MLDDSSTSLPVPPRNSRFCWYLPSDPIETGVDGGGSLSALRQILGSYSVNFCSGCGKPVVLGNQFCSGCGAPVVAVENAMSLVGTSAAPMAYAGVPPVPTEIAPPPPPPPAAVTVAPAGVTGTGLKVPSRKVLVLAGAAVVLVALVVVGGVIARNMLRGGADSPEQAASKMIESISNKDLVGMFTMVTPRERDAVLRTKDVLVNKYADLKIADAAKIASGKDSSGSGNDGAGADLSFDGIDVTITGVQPRITPISADLAAVNLDSGEFRVSIDPTKTKGMVRAQLDALGATKNYQQDIFLADLGKNRSGLTVIAKKTDGRWYISPMLSGLDIDNNYFDGTRGTIRTVAAKGSDSAQAAASAAVSALPTFLHDGPKALAPYVESDEATAIDLYGATLLPWLSSVTMNESGFAMGSTSFTAGPQDGDRAVAFVDRISFSDDSNGKTTITANCVSLNGRSDKTCFNGSSYDGSSGRSMSFIGNPFLWAADRGKFALTTVTEDGGSKVSLLDTAADHIISWTNSLTREQALRFLGLERGDKATATLTVGKQSTVSYNSAGYAVLKLHVPQSQRLELTQASDGEIFGPDGKSVTTLYSGDSSGDGGSVVKAGDYTLVLNAGQNWQEAFAKKANKVAYSAPVLIQKYVNPDDAMLTDQEVTKEFLPYGQVSSADSVYTSPAITPSRCTPLFRALAVPDGGQYRARTFTVTPSSGSPRSAYSELVVYPDEAAAAVAGKARAALDMACSSTTYTFDSGSHGQYTSSQMPLSAPSVLFAMQESVNWTSATGQVHTSTSYEVVLRDKRIFAVVNLDSPDTGTTFSKSDVTKMVTAEVARMSAAQQG
mgnify:CR=1 FL=1